MPKKKILVLMKRFGSNKDMVKENFGREIRLFEQLADKYEIDFVCPDYYKKEMFNIKKNSINFFVVPANFLNAFTLFKFLNNKIKNKKYDVIIPTTEPLFGIMGYFFSRKYKIPIIYEVQDNYEIYDSYKIPFVRFFDYKVIKNADFVFYSNYPLLRKHLFLRKKNVEVIENGVDLELFKLVPKHAARKSLKISQKIKLITYTGSISKDRGLDKVIEAVGQLRHNENNIFLLLSGKIKDIDLNKPWIIYKELPKREQVVMALNASDLLVLASTDNPFTRYSFPQKLFEYMAVNVPIVATEVGDVARILKPFKGALCRPGNMMDLKGRIKAQLKRRKVDYRRIAEKYTWEKLAKRLERIIVKVI